MTEVEWLSAGIVRSKHTGRWHAVVKYGDEAVVSQQSFETREDVLVFLKELSDRVGGYYCPIQ
jgi:hypothetical protein